jgi:transposase
VAIGVDSHKSSLAVGALDDVGRVVGTREFANDERGHARLLDWVKSYGGDRVIGIEGSGNFGAALARKLIAENEDVRSFPRSCRTVSARSVPRMESRIATMRSRSLG